MSIPVFDLPWWGYIVAFLGLVQVTIASTTLYLHRGMAHRSVDYHPIISHFFRFWLWLTTGMITKEWMAVHRKHHAKCEGPEDPHSPQQVGINRVLWGGVFLYRNEAAKKETLERFGFGAPNDWIERKLYTPHNFMGVILLAVLYVTLFGWAGALMWLGHVMWIPFWAAGVINGIGHYWGYRNFDTPDTSSNLIPVAFFIGGEELHNNHHAFPTSAKFSSSWREFDIGWLYLRILSFFKLSRIKNVLPTPSFNVDRPVTIDTLKSVVAARYHLLAVYMTGLRQLMREESSTVPRALLQRHPMRLLRAWLSHGEMDTFPNKLRNDAQRVYEEAACSPKVQAMLKMGRELVQLWQRSSMGREQLIEHLQEWLKRAELSGIRQIQDLAQRVRACAI